MPVTALSFSDCDLATDPADLNIARIYTEDRNTVKFQLQYVASCIVWIALGLSTSTSLSDNHIFLCHRSANEAVVIEERYASRRATLPTVASQLTTNAYSNTGNVLNCTFSSPITRIFSVCSNILFKQNIRANREKLKKFILTISTSALRLLGRFRT